MAFYRQINLKSTLILLILSGVFSLESYSQENSECLSCHDDKTLTMQKNGKVMPLGVYESNFKKFAHNKLNCIDCHKGFDPYETPHKAKITPVNCRDCHKDPVSKHLFHPQMFKSDGMSGSPDVNCRNCHNYHYPEFKKNKGSRFHVTNLTNACGNCHQKEKTQHLKSEHYSASLKIGEKTPSCIYCHSQPITPGSKLNAAALKNKQVDLCLNCHVSDSVTKTQYSKSLINFKQSVHGAALLKGQAEAPTCIDCHGTHDLEKSNKPGSKIHKFNVHNVCSKCHISVSYEYEHSVHGLALAKKNPDAPSCSDCHGEHEIRQVEHSQKSVFSENHILRTTVQNNKMMYCIECHDDEKLSKKYKLSTISKAHEWLPNLVSHYQTVRCIDCHSSYMPPNLSHDILAPEMTIKKCEDCHSKESILVSKLFKHEKKQSREKYGFINGTILSDTYVIGTTRNILLDTLSLIILGMVVAGLGIHGILRWYFGKDQSKEKSNEEPENE